MAMAQFSLGDKVVIRYGKRQGEKARIIKSIPGDDYKVKTEHGFVLFYTGKGLEKDQPFIARSSRLAQKHVPAAISK